jgi:DNA-directed RNA polymerase II subunit RPB1
MAMWLLNANYIPHLLAVLNSMCIKCSRLRGCGDVSSLKPKLQSLIRFRDEAKKTKICARDAGGCGCSLPVRIFYDQKSAMITVVWSNVQTSADDDSLGVNDGSLHEPLTGDQVWYILSKLSAADRARLGLSCDPTDWLIKYLRVISSELRPHYSSGDTVHEAAMNIIYANLSKQNGKIRGHLNNLLRLGVPPNPQENPLKLYYFLVQSTLSALVGRGAGGMSMGKDFGQRSESEGLVDQITGKHGTPRKYLLSGRCYYTARCPITGDPFLPLGTLGIPEKVAKILTYPEGVTPDNFKEMQELVHRGPRKYPGANFVVSRSRGRSTKIDLTYNPSFALELGDTVMRHLQDGDVGVLNRQPTLHKGSKQMCTFRIGGTTFHFNPNWTGIFNADFDGDEMNIHVPQSHATRTELELLAGLDQNMILASNSRPSIQIIQDPKLGIYLMSLQNTQPMSLQDTVHIGTHIGRPLAENNRAMTPSELVMSTVPPTVPLQDVVRNKMLNTGAVVQKAWINDSRSAMRFMDESSLVANTWLSMRGFTLAFNDLHLNPDTNKAIQARLSDFEQRITDLIGDYQQNAQQSGMTEAQYEKSIYTNCAAVLSNMSDRVNEHVNKDNAFYAMSTAGSKGKPINLGQIMACVGSQNVQGKRLAKKFNGRTLPYFYKDDDSISARGFVSSSYTTGMTLPEFLSHAFAGREGMIDTALKTADVGYMIIRLVKALEDIVAQYDGTVSTIEGTVYQSRYAGCNHDPSRMVWCQMRCLSDTDDDVAARYLVRDSPKYSGSYTRSAEAALEHRIRTGRDILRRAYVSLPGFNRDSLVPTWLVPVDLDDVVHQHTGAGTSQQGQDGAAALTTGHVWDALDRFFADPATHASLPHAEHHFATDASMRTSNVAFETLVLTTLSPKQCVDNYGLDVRTFDTVMATVRRRLDQARIVPGTPVGIIAAQSIGQPLQQMTLNTFHQAGITSAEQLGQPRVNEILNLTSNPKTPTMEIPLLPGVSSKDVLRTFQNITVGDVVDFARVYYQVPDEQIQLDHVWGVDSELRATCPFALRLQLSRDKLYTHGICALDVELLLLSYILAQEEDRPHVTKRVARTVFKGLEHVAVRGCVEDGPVSVVYFFFNTVADELSVNRFAEIIMKLKKLSIEGIPDVAHADLVDTRVVAFDQGGGVRSDVGQSIVTSGINTKDIWTIAGIDVNRIRFNNVADVYELYGIAAARACIVDEMSRCFTSSGSVVNMHHIELLADFMTNTGTLISVTRHGFAKLDTGVLKKGTFEDTVPTFTDAAVYGKTDPLRTISANVIFNKLIPVGTGLCDVYLDPNQLTLNAAAHATTAPDLRPTAKFTDLLVVHSPEKRCPALPFPDDA